MSQLMTISDAVQSHARLRPTHLACRDSRRAMTYAQLDLRSSQLAAALLNSGLNKGDRVAVIAYNRIEWFEIYIALARVGLVAVPLNFRLSSPEIEYILLNCEARGVIAGAEFTEAVDAVRPQLKAVEPRFVTLAEQPVEGWIGYEAFIGQGASHLTVSEGFPAVGAEDMCALMYTSGTTGRPKGAIRQHSGSALISMATALERGLHATTSACWSCRCAMPIRFIFSTPLSTLALPVSWMTASVSALKSC